MLLIVDHDPEFLEATGQLLDFGWGVFVAGDGKHAKELIRSVGAALSVVLVDLDLPKEDGFLLIRELREEFPDLPVVAISGAMQRGVLQRTKVLGAADALVKPINSEWKAAIGRVRRRRAGVNL